MQRRKILDASRPRKTRHRTHLIVFVGERTADKRQYLSIRDVAYTGRRIGAAIVVTFGKERAMSLACYLTMAICYRNQYWITRQGRQLLGCNRSLTTNYQLRSTGLPRRRPNGRSPRREHRRFARIYLNGLGKARKPTTTTISASQLMNSAKRSLKIEWPDSLGM